MENIVIRKVGIRDAKEMLDFVLAVSDETDFLISNSKDRKLNLEKEIDYLSNFEKTNRAFMFVALDKDRVVGSAGITAKKERRQQHRATMGISVLKNYWGKGIGRKLLEAVVHCAKENNIKKIELEVRTDNTMAISLYKKLGFEIEGEIKNAMCVESIFYDEYIMGLFI